MSAKFSVVAMAYRVIYRLGDFNWATGALATDHRVVASKKRRYRLCTMVNRRLALSIPPGYPPMLRVSENRQDHALFV